MTDGWKRIAARADHLGGGNPLRTLTEVIDRVDGGINLGQGVCDLDPPAALVRGALDSLEGKTDRQLYTPSAGDPELRRAIARKLARDNGLEVGPEQVCATLGASGAFTAAGMALLEPGDEVILFAPFYSYHHTATRLLGGVPVPVALGADGALDVTALRAAVGPRTRAIVVNTPANPTGKVFDRQELEAIGAALAGTDVAVLTDEVYEYMVYDGRRHVSPATVPGLAERCLTMGSFSKTFSVTGWRVGYAAGPADLVDRISKVCDQLHVCVPRPMQRGVQRALDEFPPRFYTDLRADYERRRDRFCAGLAAAGFGVRPPEGAYYVMADYREVLGDLEPYDAVMAMIERARVNGVPGHLFHADPAGVRSIRFHFAVDDAVLDEAIRRLGALRS